MVDAQVATELLRERSLTSPAADFGAPAGAEAWLAAMEIAMPDVTMSLICGWDGTASVYMSTGGGVIGAGEHEAVARAAQTFVAEAGAWVDDMLPLPDLSYPGVGRVRFFARRADRCYVIEADQAELVDGMVELSGLYTLGQSVITHVRRASSSPPDSRH